jgi:hypothetical protein
VFIVYMNVPKVADERICPICEEPAPNNEVRCYKIGSKPFCFYSSPSSPFPIIFSHRTPCWPGSADHFLGHYVRSSNPKFPNSKISTVTSSNFICSKSNMFELAFVDMLKCPTDTFQTRQIVEPSAKFQTVKFFNILQNFEQNFSPLTKYWTKFWLPAVTIVTTWPPSIGLFFFSDKQPLGAYLLRLGAHFEPS